MTHFMGIFSNNRILRFIKAQPQNSAGDANSVDLSPIPHISDKLIPLRYRTVVL